MGGHVSQDGQSNLPGHLHGHKWTLKTVPARRFGGTLEEGIAGSRRRMCSSRGCEEAATRTAGSGLGHWAGSQTHGRKDQNSAGPGLRPSGVGAECSGSA